MMMIAIKITVVTAIIIARKKTTTKIFIRYNHQYRMSFGWSNINKYNVIVEQQ